MHKALSTGCLLAVATLAGAQASQGPHALTAVELDAILSTPRAWFAEGHHSGPGGIAARLSSVAYGTLSLQVRADRRLNLSRGEPNDLMSAHGGTLRLEIESVTDRSGRNVYHPSGEKSWGARVLFRRGEEQSLRAIREIPVDEGTTLQDIVAVKGTWHVEVPVELVEVVVAGSPARLSRTHPAIREMAFDGTRLRLTHPRPVPSAIVTVLGFDREGVRVAVTGTGHGGRQPDNHWYQFVRNRTVVRIRLWIAGEFAHREHDLVIDAR